VNRQGNRQPAFWPHRLPASIFHPPRSHKQRGGTHHAQRNPSKRRIVMHHRSYAIRVDADTGRRLVRLQRGTGTPIRKLVVSLLRDYLDLPRHPRARRCRRRR
jgi:hypothetical protein